MIPVSYPLKRFYSERLSGFSREMIDIILAELNVDRFAPELVGEPNVISRNGVYLDISASEEQEDRYNKRREHRKEMEQRKSWNAIM